MNAERTLRFKIASEESEFEQVFRLNYKTFVEEIPQHPPNPEKRLVDRFHHENAYLIALDGDQLIGMMAVRDKRPFSLDEKLGNIDRYLPPGRKICEVRLLAVLPSHRNGMVFQGLLKLLLDYGLSQHYNLAVISGTLANDMVAAQLSLMSAPGIILSNGEFGDRLVDHATRFSLSFDALELDWGGVFDREQVGQTLDRHRGVRWLWASACETSTGV